jgi:NAD(P)-dependent dehydrogenase (short-subunit alcohol dehydrogenase family)
MKTGKHQGRRVLVTGASSGIGLAVVRALADEGARAIMVGRSHERLVAALAQLETPEHHRLVEADLADHEQVNRASGALAGQGILLDGMVHCAGVFQPTPFERIGPGDLERTWAVNARGPFLLTQAIAPQLRDGAAIVFVTSVSAHVGMAGQSAYAMSKGAVEALSRTLAVELAPRLIRANTIAPGFVATPMNEDFRRVPGVAERRARAALADRLGTPEEIASVASFLLSDEAAFVNGTTIHANGGYPIAEVQRNEQRMNSEEY